MYGLLWMHVWLADQALRVMTFRQTMITSVSTPVSTVWYTIGLTMVIEYARWGVLPIATFVMIVALNSIAGTRVMFGMCLLSTGTDIGQMAFPGYVGVPAEAAYSVAVGLVLAVRRGGKGT